MATERQRRAAATATTGAALTFGGGVLRHSGTDAAHNGKVPAWQWRKPLATHPTRALLRTGARGRTRYLLGAGLGLAGAPALAVGGHDLLTRKPVRKRSHRSFVGEGLAGTQDALEQRAQGLKEVPPQHKAGPLAVGAVSGLTGSLAAHRTMDRFRYFQGAHRGGRAGIAAVAGTAAAAASFPLARHTVRSNDYEVTPTGVRRRKKPLVRPSSKATRARSGSRSLSADVGKVHNPHNLTPTTARGTARKVHWRSGANDHAVCGLDGAFGRGTGPFAEHYGEVTCAGCARMMRIRKADGDYYGRHVSHREQRARTMAGGAIPLVPFAGPVAAAHQAGKFAPPGEKRKAEARQAASSAGSTAVGAVGAYTAAKNPRVGMRAQQVHGGMQRAGDRLTRPVKSRLKVPGGSRVASVKAGTNRRVVAAAVKHPKAMSHALRAAGPLAHNPKAAVAGYAAGKLVSGQPMQNFAISRNLKAQDRYNLKHPVVKLADGQMTLVDRRKLSRKKRLAATSSTVTGLMGLGALGARVAHKPDLGVKLLTGSAAVGGANSLNFAGVLRREAKAGDPDTKLKKSLDGKVHMAWHSGGSACGLLNAPRHRLSRQWSQVNCSSCRQAKWLFGKAQQREPLTRMRGDQAHEIVRRYGDAGPLPNTLSRDERMKAYEARYVHAGGHKAEHWQRRADRADKVKTAGLAGATVGGGAIMALRHPKIAGRLGERAHTARHAADTATIGAATVSGAGELYAGHARRRRSTYSNSKAGVAASALRRMKDYQN